MRALWGGTAVFCLLWVGGCGGSSSGERVVIYAEQTICVDEESGDGLRAQQLALKEAGGRVRGLRVELKPLENCDTATGYPSPEKVARNARRAAADPDAIAYLDVGRSAFAAQALPITNRAGLLQISTTASYAGLTVRGAAPGDPVRYYPTGRRNFARLIRPDHVQAAVMVKMLREEGISRLAVTHDCNLYGKGLASLVARRATGRGMQVVGGVQAWAKPPRCVASRDELAVLAQTVSQQGAEAILIAGDLTDQILPAVARAAPELVVVSGDGAVASGIAAAAESVEDQIRLTGPPLPSVDHPDYRAFTDAFRDSFGRDPADPVLYYEYEAVRALLAALERAERVDDRSAVMRAFLEQPPRRSAFGTYAFDKNGDPTLRNYDTFRIREGRIVSTGLLRAAP